MSMSRVVDVDHDDVLKMCVHMAALVQLFRPVSPRLTFGERIRGST